MKSCSGYGRMVLFIFLSFFFLSVSAWSKSPSELQTIQLFYENDLFAGTDEYYTNAIQITWLSSDLSKYEDDARLPKWSIPVIKAIPFSSSFESVHNVAIILGQQIYTPSNTQTTIMMGNCGGL